MDEFKCTICNKERDGCVKCRSKSASKCANHWDQLEKKPDGWMCKPCIQQYICSFPGCFGMMTKCTKTCYNKIEFCYKHNQNENKICDKCDKIRCEKCNVIVNRQSCRECNNRYCDDCNKLIQIDLSPMTLMTIGGYTGFAFASACTSIICTECLGDRTIKDIQLKSAIQMYGDREKLSSVDEE
jgi:hypothetical protein